MEFWARQALRCTDVQIGGLPASTRAGAGLALWATLSAPSLARLGPTERSHADPALLGIAALTHVGTWGAVPVLPGWSAAQLAAEAGEHDGESFVEFGGAVVGGQDGGEGAQPGKLGDGQPVQPEAE